MLKSFFKFGDEFFNKLIDRLIVSIINKSSFTTNNMSSSSLITSFTSRNKGIFKGVFVF
jgi:hypothetical protein